MTGARTITRPTELIIVDDEAELRDMVAEYLGRHGFAVRTAAGGAECDACIAAGMPDLMILDVTMPDEDGFSIARRVRARHDVPILMLTAADDVVDRVAGLELGADDYMTKPFDLRELLARVRALLRRRVAVAPPPPQNRNDCTRMGDLTLDFAARQLRRPDGTELELTAMEFDLLAILAKNPNRVLSRERLLDLAHSRAGDVFDRSIDVRITRIRHKVEADPSKPQIIKTLRGAGYMFVSPKS